MRKRRIISLCLASALALSLAACNSPTDEQNSAQPTPSTQPTAAPTPTPTPPIPFTDVAQDSPYYDAVVWAYKNGIASDGETFGPADACTRGQVMTFLWRAKGSPEPQTTESPFRDVSSDDWFYKPALWASENGIATGTAFNPGNPCTNAEALTFLWRAEGKPAASVYNGAVALAASGQYYARPAAWAEANGLFAGAEFDPAAPCSRAELMAYLYWDTEEWTFAEEDKTIQAEYEQIINDAQLYEVHGSGLVYADYVDVDNDGKVELLTVGLSDDAYHNKAIVTVYANLNGHAEKYCEGAIDFTHLLSICVSDGRPFFKHDTYGNIAETHEFYKIENGTLELDEKIEIYYGGDAVPEEVDKAFETYEAILQKFTDEKELLKRDYSSSIISVLNRGLVPSREEYEAALAKQWEAEREKVYAAVKNGDFSYFAGTYTCGFSYSSDRGNLMLNDDGTLTGNIRDSAVNKKPISISVGKNGAIHCVIVPVGSESTEDGQYEVFRGEEYYICPIGTKEEESVDSVYVPSDLGTNTVRIIYIHWGGTAGPDPEVYYK